MNWIAAGAGDAGRAVGRLAVLRARRAVGACRQSLNMFTLIALGTGTAWLYSVVATVAPGLFPPSLRGSDGMMPVYFEPAAVIVVLVLVGQVLELRARDATGGADQGAAAARRRARRCASAQTAADDEVAIEAIAVGDRLRVRPGEKVPVDGAVSEGSGVGRRVDHHRRADARHQGGRRHGDRRHCQPQRRLRHDGRAGRRRHHAGAHRQDGVGGAAQPRADPAARRRGGRAGSCRLVVAVAALHRRRGLDDLGAAAARSRTPCSPRSRC